MRAKHLLYALMLLSVTMLSSCALMPEEEVVRTAPVVREYEGEEYEKVVVERGELTLIEKVTCRYQPVQTEALSFALGGELVDRMLVKTGDFVEKGQLLGQLHLGDLEERIQAANRNIEELELRIDHLDDAHALELRRGEIEYAELEPLDRQEAFKALEEGYIQSRRELSDQLTIQRVELESLQADLDERQIRAPFAGTVTYVKKYKDGDMSTFGQNAVKVADSTMSLFRSETEYWEYFHAGDVYSISVKKQPYTVVVADEASLGLEETERIPGEKAYVYFVLQESGTMFEDGDVGTVDLVLAHRDDTLYVHRDAVIRAGDIRIVYYEREDGLRSYKEVEVGITADRKTEILSGLVEGESIIME